MGFERMEIAGIMAYGKMSALLTIALLVAMTPGTSNGQVIPENATIWPTISRAYYISQTAAWTEGQLEDQDLNLKHVGFPSKDGLAYDYRYGILVGNSPVFKVLYLKYLNSGDSTREYEGTSPDVGQMTFDWTARNLYWADGGYGWIAMKPLPKSYSVTPNDIKIVVEKLDKPTGITINPVKNFLFWADAGDNPTIERSNLVGDERKVLIWDSLMSPTCLTIDLVKDRLYWSDQSRGTIEYSDFDGNGRAVLASSPDHAYYGVSVFQESLIFTAPNLNITGFISLNENFVERSRSYKTLNSSFFYVTVNDKKQQPKTNNRCDSINPVCHHICVNRENDKGASCYCYDGYTLDNDGKTCSVETRKHHLLYTNGSSICSSIAAPVATNKARYLLFPSFDCDIVSHTDTIWVFALDMAANIIFFASRCTIYNKTISKESDSDAVLTDIGKIIDMDFDWKSKELFWINSVENAIHYVDTSEDTLDKKTKSLTSKITNIAVDPHNRKLYFISKNSYLHVWQRDSDKVSRIYTSYLKQPTDLEYNRLKDSLVWSDASGYLGEINADGKNAQTYNIDTPNAGRNAVTVFKKFLMSSRAENNHLVDVVYVRNSSYYDHYTSSLEVVVSILDMHVFDTTLQPLNLDPCEVDNGGCEHMCVHGNDEHRCSCRLGYHLLDDARSCGTSILDSDFFLVLDTLDSNIYKIARNVTVGRIGIVTIKSNNRPSAIAFNMKTSEVVWVDQISSRVKRKFLKDSSESVIGSPVHANAQLAVDIIGGNIYVTDGDKILVIDVQNNVKTIQVQGIQGTLGKIALHPEKWKMVWVETGSTPRVVMANMDGTNDTAIVSDIKQPEDVAFDVEKGDRFYWCDSELKKIEEVMIESSAPRVVTVVYNGTYVGPVALDVSKDHIYFILQYQRNIYQINKDGTRITKFMESPLFGKLTHLLVLEPLPKGDKELSDDKKLSDDKEFQLPLVAGAAGLGAAVIIIAVVMVIVCRRRKQRKGAITRPPALPPLSYINDVTNETDRPRDSGIKLSSFRSSARSLTIAEAADGGEYYYVDDAMLENDPYHTIPSTEVDDGYLKFTPNGGASPKGLYGADNNGYIEFAADDGASAKGLDVDDNDGYLDARFCETSTL